MDLPIHSSEAIPIEIFDSLFNENYYNSEEYANAYHQISQIMPGKVANYHHIKGRILAWHAFNEKEKNILKTGSYRFISIVNEDNYASQTPSLREYTVLVNTPYEEIYKNRYKKHFRNQVHQGRRNSLELIRSDLSKVDLLEAYRMNTEQMRRLHSYRLPFNIWNIFLTLPSSSLYFVCHKNTKIGYAQTFENKSNVYLSLQGSGVDSRNLRPNNFIYDTIIKKVMDSGKNFHMGSGFHNQGYEQFKQKIGGIAFKVETNPSMEKTNEHLYKLYHSIMGRTVMDAINLTGIDKILYKKILFESIPRS